MVYNLPFGVAFLLLPHLSTIILLAAVNYTWHAFVDPNDLENAYVGSVTIINGQYNIFNEDYHVEHHMHPQMHWTEAERHYNEQIDEYRAHMGDHFPRDSNL